MSNKILKAFLEQSGIDPTSHTQTETHEKALIKQEKTDDIKAQMQIREDRIKQKSTIGDPLSNHIDIPTQINSEDLNETPESHPQFAKYDHSLEKARWRDIGGAYDPIEMGDLDTDDY